MLRDEAYYPGPHIFKPERFLPLLQARDSEYDKLSPADPKSIIFGFGRRCVRNAWYCVFPSTYLRQQGFARGCTWRMLQFGFHLRVYLRSTIYSRLWIPSLELRSYQKKNSCQDLPCKNCWANHLHFFY